MKGSGDMGEERGIEKKVREREVMGKKERYRETKIQGDRVKRMTKREA